MTEKLEEGKVYICEVVLFFMSECIFCKIVRGEMESEKVGESENFVVIGDAFPKLEEHSLVVSKKHFKHFMEMDSSLGCEMFELVKKVAKDQGWDEFNLVTNQGKSAGQIVEHVHFHVLPRKEGDGFEFGL